MTVWTLVSPVSGSVARTLSPTGDISGTGLDAAHQDGTVLAGTGPRAATGWPSAESRRP
ncbi:hypothetical protein OG828_31365 [Streptomyces sp. NBC_00457]|uniref:hypothetical protein n=1 Tax=Streptomyces sp. NBC_00457 TaxID=2975748 RepID=UPI002E1F9F75